MEEDTTKFITTKLEIKNRKNEAQEMETMLMFLCLQ